LTARLRPSPTALPPVPHPAPGATVGRTRGPARAMRAGPRPGERRAPWSTRPVGSPGGGDGPAMHSRGDGEGASGPAEGDGTMRTTAGGLTEREGRPGDAQPR